MINSSLKKAKIYNNKIIIRTDFNVPIIDNIIQSTKRIDSALKTIKFVLENKPKQIIIISHLGRPNGIEKKLTLEPIRNYLSKILKTNVDLCFIDKISENKNLIVLLENIRFYPEETNNLDSTINFRKKLSELGDIYINDAFGCCHRAHSSIVGINTKYKYMGFLVEKELNYLKNSLNSDGIKTLILGGSKVGDKIKLIKNLIPKMNNILIGGGMAFTFLKYHNVKIGKSLIDIDNLKSVKDILSFAEKYNTKIILPIDFRCNDIFSNDGNICNFTVSHGIPSNFMGLDIGDNTISLFNSILVKSDIIIWNGPLGVFEFDNFAKGSKDILNYISTLKNTTKIIGGGDIVSCCEKFNLSSKMDHVSTGGGASLELLEGKILPGIKFLENSAL